MMDGVTYDTGALVAADRNDRRMWALHAGFLAEEIAPTHVRKIADAVRARLTIERV